jgi:ABC-type multidrug transport system ATPase subunit
LTGEIRPPTAGQVFVAGHSVTAEGVSKAYEHLGNCPQIDPLFPLLTGKQQLSFYGLMKGVPIDAIDETVDGLLQRLGIEAADRTKPVQTYSGGMKRKLSLAISFIGRSDVLFLDEPSAAVDASAKRLLWQAIKLRSAKRTVILTTHSMEEAEACCDRIAIQVTGQLRCLGTALHLKGKYGTGYQLEVRLLKKSKGQSNKDRSDMLMKFMTTKLSPSVELLEAHEDCFLYQLPAFQTSGLSLGQIFTKLQVAKTELNIEDYSLAQPSLEQVFLRFAKEQAVGNTI